MTPPERFTLEDHEINSELWRKLKKHLNSRLDLHRKTNENDLGDVDTAKVRGRIAEIKALLSLEKPPLVVD